MLDERDLQMISELLGDQKREIVHEVVALIEVKARPKFDLLAEKSPPCRKRWRT